VCYARGGLLEHSRISLNEEYMEQKIEGQRSEVDECG
jgi:hypothetical protein